MQARQRQGSAEQTLAAAQQRTQQLSSGGSAPKPSTGVIDTRTLGKPKTFTGQPSEWTTWQFTIKALACATHARMRDVFELATRKGSDPVINSDMTVELQSLSTQLYYMLVMMLSDQALEIVLNSPEGVGAEVWRKSFWEYEPGVGIRYGAMLQSLLKRRYMMRRTWHERLSHSSVTSPSTSSSPVISSVMPSSTELCVEAWHSTSI